MDKAVLIIGIICAIECIALLIKPEIYKYLAAPFVKIPYLAAVIKSIVGIIFLIAARECGKTPIVIALGIITIASGAILFVIKPAKIKTLIQWLIKCSPITMRLIAIVGLMISGLIIYSVFE